MQALAADPQNAELYANRAQTLLKMENFLEAVEDASKALDLNPRLSKAHLRKGCAVSGARLLSCSAANLRRLLPWEAAVLHQSLSCWHASCCWIKGGLENNPAHRCCVLDGITRGLCGLAATCRAFSCVPQEVATLVQSGSVPCRLVSWVLRRRDAAPDPFCGGAAQCFAPLTATRLCFAYCLGRFALFSLDGRKRQALVRSGTYGQGTAQNSDPLPVKSLSTTKRVTAQG